MNHPASWRALGRLAGWALPILAGLFLAPPDVRAECADYVRTRLPHAGTPHTPAAPREPCRGPGCSQAPVAPPASAPPVESQTSDEWGSPADGPPLAPPGLTAVLSARAAPRPARLPKRIFHPPRPVSAG